MKLRADVIRVYKDVHTWAGILSSLALFIAFYAGAITMFETPLQRWATPPATLAPPPPLEQTQRLIDATLATHPEAARSYRIVVNTSPEDPARMTWRAGTAREAEGNGEVAQFAASFAADGSLQVVRHEPSGVAQLIDLLHQQIGLPFPHEVSMPIMGAIALLYSLALVSGVIIFLPTFFQDLFATRLGANLKRMWLDVHNVLGVLSLPFHLVMALTAVVFALHDPIYATQDAVNYGGRLERMLAPSQPQQPKPSSPQARPLAPAQILRQLGVTAPGFDVHSLEYTRRGDQQSLRVAGFDARYGHRGPTFGFLGVDPYSGQITSTDFLPGHQDGWFATVTGFFTLHFGSFGGEPVRWGYFLLGLAGAFLFHSGNLLWIESRRRMERRHGAVTQKRSTRIMASLTVGVTAGCMAGISLSIAAAKWLPGRVDSPDAWHEGIYYAVFLAAIAWAFLRGAAQASAELLLACAAATLTIPVSSALSASGWISNGWNHGGTGWLIDAVALLGGLLFVFLARRSHMRARRGRRDSVWAAATA